MNNLGCGPRGIGGNAFLLRIAEKFYQEVFKRDGMKKLIKEFVISTVEFRRIVLDVSAGVKV